MSPQRIQRKRTKGWRMPEGVVYVGRGTRWGNPYRAGEPIWTGFGSKPAASSQDVVNAFADDIAIWACDVPDHDEIVAKLRGKDLACWCPLNQPCHADVLLEVANR